MTASRVGTGQYGVDRVRDDRDQEGFTQTRRGGGVDEGG